MHPLSVCIIQMVHVASLLQMIRETLDERGGELMHSLCDGETVIWRGWADILVQSTGKSGRTQYALTYRLVDGKIVSLTEMVDSGQALQALCLSPNRC